MEKEHSSEQEFLRHLITLIRDKVHQQIPMSKAANDFESGKSLAYHEIADVVLECSRIFNVPLRSLGVSDLDPDMLL
jgi:hypothetical protein